MKNNSLAEFWNDRPEPPKPLKRSELLAMAPKEPPRFMGAVYVVAGVKEPEPHETHSRFNVLLHNKPDDPLGTHTVQLNFDLNGGREWDAVLDAFCYTLGLKPEFVRKDFKLLHKRQILLAVEREHAHGPKFQPHLMGSTVDEIRHLIRSGEC